MKDFLIGAGIGFVIGAVMAKSNRDLSKAVEKGKEMVEEKVEEGKKFIQKNIVKPTKKAAASKK